MISVFATTAAELTELQPVRSSLFILSRNVIAILAIVTLKHNIIARHKYLLVIASEYRTYKT